MEKKSGERREPTWGDPTYRVIPHLCPQPLAMNHLHVNTADVLADRNVALNNRHRTTDTELRDPGHVPTPPRPQTGFARGRLSPRRRPHLFGFQKSPLIVSELAAHDWAPRSRGLELGLGSHA